MKSLCFGFFFLNLFLEKLIRQAQSLRFFSFSLGNLCTLQQFAGKTVSIEREAALNAHSISCSERKLKVCSFFFFFENRKVASQKQSYTSLLFRSLEE